MPNTLIRPIVTKIERPASLLCVGNSFFFFNNGICRFLRLLLKGLENPPKFRTNMVTINGGSLSWHDVESYFKPNGISSYAFDKDNNVVFRDPSEKLWDAVLLLDSSQGPIHPVLGPQFAAEAKKDAKIVRRHGATPVFVTTWAYRGKPEMTEQLANAVVKVANENEALVVPVGPAFADAMANRPGLDLIIEDGRHPTPAGTFLFALVIIEAVLNIDVRTIKGTPFVDADLGEYLKASAHQTVAEFLGRSAS